MSVEQGRVLFEALYEDLDQSCGGCHTRSGTSNTPFLGAEDASLDEVYAAVTSWPDVVVRQPSTRSVLITWPRQGHFNGPTPEPLEARLVEWLEEEAEVIADSPEGKPFIPPFRPILDELNAVYLDDFGPEFEGMSITFIAREIGPTTLSLTQLEVFSNVSWALAFEHPLFTVYPAGSLEGQPDPGDSFSNVTQEVFAGQSAELGPGELILTNWVQDGKLSIAFESIDVFEGGDGGGVDGCAALPVFEQEAAPLLDANCATATCHGGDTSAGNALDMRDLGSDPASACSQLLNRVLLTNPAGSQIFLNTDPQGGAGHPFKFQQDLARFVAFRDGVTIWIEAERDSP